MSKIKQDVREIVLDTETTGLHVRDGHKLIEIGCVELINRCRTGKFFHSYIKPSKSVDPAAFKVHGISDEFLQDKKTFSQIAKQFRTFVGESKLIIHNAPFDMNFLNHELEPLGIKALSNDKVVDTLILARKKFPGSPASLDALCKRFGVSANHRTKHGALVDAELLATVYILMCGTTQATINFCSQNHSIKSEDNWQLIDQMRKEAHNRPITLSPEEKDQHNNLLQKIRNPIWSKL